MTREEDTKATKDTCRYRAEYRDGLYFIIDTTKDEVVPSTPDEWKAYREGYTFAYPAEAIARIMNRTGHK
jgi:hypothetical protein